MIKKLSLLVAAMILSVAVLGCNKQDVGDAEKSPAANGKAAEAAPQTTATQGALPDK